METCIYLKHDSGAMHQYGGRRYAKLRREIFAGRGNDIITDLICSGYKSYLAIDGEQWDLENLPNHFSEIVRCGR
jgi:hypothetical protein